MPSAQPNPHQIMCWGKYLKCIHIYFQWLFIHWTALPRDICVWTELSEINWTPRAELLTVNLKSENGLRPLRLPTGLALGHPLFTPPISYNKCCSEQKYPKFIFRALHASLSWAFQNPVLRNTGVVRRSWTVLLGGLTESQFHHLSSGRPGQVSSFQGLDFLFCKWDRTMHITLGCWKDEIGWRMWKFFISSSS